MEDQRTIRRIISAQPVIEGAGVHLKRVFGFGKENAFDPFLLLDDFRSDTPAHFVKGFPWHPHRGIETITYVLQGDVEHGDSLGNSGVISAGDVQWMTAGSGIIHQEMPLGDDDGRMYGFQLWANLPAAQKMMAPRYNDITADRIPEVVLETGARVKIIAGTVGDARGPMADIVIDPEYLDVTVPAGASFIHPTPPDYTAFIYLIGGQGLVGGQTVSDGNLTLFNSGPALAVEALDAEVRFLLITGKPLGEPVAWRGPIVMNTQAELETAFREYREGDFIKSHSPSN